MAKKDRTGNRKSREQRKQFKVPELGILGLAAQILDEYMRPKPGRSIPKPMSRCMENSVNSVMKKRQFR